MVSYLEIYNENIRDLLNPYEDLNANHALKELPGVGVTVPTLSTHTVVNAEECYNLLNMGNRNRVVGATLMNANSSRSHSIFTISLEQIPIEDDSVEKIPVAGGIRRGKLNLVDLAGSERQNKTKAVGERFREATKINLSLSALGNVISALVDGKTKHIPYRDSKLTRLLQVNYKYKNITYIRQIHKNYKNQSIILHVVFSKIVYYIIFCQNIVCKILDEHSVGILYKSWPKVEIVILGSYILMKIEL